jgi:hypothetical protein
MTAAHIRLGEGTPPAPSAGEGILYFDSGDQQLYVIDAAGATVGPIGGGGGGGGITAANVLYVQTVANGGDNATAARGDSTKPYSTIAAALADALDGDVLLLGAGSFIGPGSVYASNPTLKDISIIGQGQKLTSVTASGAGPCFEMTYGSPAPNLVEWEQLVLARLTLIGDGSNPLVLDGSASAPVWFPAPFTDNRFGACLFDVDVTTSLPGGSLVFASCGYVRLERINERSSVDALQLLSVNNSEVIAKDVVISTIKDALNFAAPNPPPTGCLGSTYEGCTVRSEALLAGQTRSTWIDCTFFVFRDDSLQVAALQFPQIQVRGGSATVLDLSISGIPDAPFNMLFDFAGVSLGIVNAGVQAPALNRQTVRLRGCSISQTTNAGDGVDLDGHTSLFFLPAASAFVTSPGPVGGAIRPPHFDLPSVALPAAPPPAGALLTFGFTLYNPNGYVALLESDNVAAGSLAAVLKTTTGVTCEASIGAGAGNVTGIVYVK